MAPSFYRAALILMFAQNGGETPAQDGAETNFFEIGQAQKQVLSLKLDQVRFNLLMLAWKSQWMRRLHSKRKAAPRPLAWRRASIPKATSQVSKVRFCAPMPR